MTPSTARKPLYKSLYVQVLFAVTVGVLLGHFHPELGAKMKPLGDAFIKLIKMIIAPIIFCTVVVGIAGMEDMKKVGKTGGLALLYFEVVSTVALLIGLLVVNLIQPGSGMHVDAASLDTTAIAAYTEPGKMKGTVDFLLGVIPSSVVDAFAKGDILQVLLFSVLFGFALHKFGGRGTMVFDFIEKSSHVLFDIVGIIMKVAPIGAFGAMAFTIGKYGIGSLFSLGKLMGTFYLTCLLFVFVVLGFISRLHGFSIVKFIRYIKEELLIVLGTSSSESVLPRMMEKMENLGAKKSVVGLVIPTGYSFNLDGTSIYLTMAAVFIAQATDTPMTLVQQLTLLAVLLLTSKGAAGITGSGFIVLAATLSAVGGVPVAGLALILGIDRFMSEARALTNLVGNGVATLVVAKWTGDLDMQRLQQGLDHPTAQEAQEPEEILDLQVTHMALNEARS
ncbi:MAG TPA: C4-dicarboxylate transporter DctA [Hydrogenophaga sp.]|uniref:dicarboxylate/amino acid:cation symporter n=1 Tax=Hydrogenophaga sp. TaxID=1904254 RepID=UPI0008C9B55B|nr:dicarboxylate/amino acid:cation symporter [Hydrogenophaga sp.]MBU4184318.1 dicarboxylate/amino acid:cation symporter [Gammaproteobacteria bacterium]OGA77021.1 MAG: C4-dicarboxylate transporter DctA [Burkholderiales bacterium GWE1_65_30]OGA90482.1 MAG: C4-dicarboxylate transporter DctA [Burkholderiales bacterium GWF1_66_17]PKO78489.1 MAG: C4-dicarboxylate transporter DctA [Betaproteobacteria bacterium HGW-Betaproteobacteria-15]MBU4279258.1 dicarboxylate/amino acid:cation symporter [Gammaprot